MLKNKKTMRIFSLILAISMLLSFAPTVMAEETAEETESTGTSSAILYENYFDTNAEANFTGFSVYNSGGTALESGYSVSSSNWAEGGYLNISGGTHQLTILNTDITSKASDDAIIVYEARIKQTNGTDDKDLETINYSTYPVFVAGSTSKSAAARIFAMDGGIGFSSSAGGSGTKTVDNYPIKKGEFYTYRIIYDKAKDMVKYSVSNETQGTVGATDWSKFYSTSFNPDYIMINSSRWFMTSTVDYIRIYDESKLPKAAASANDGVDTTAVKDNDVFTVKLENAITADDLKASPITISDSNVDMASVLSEDGKTITLTLSNLGSSRSYKITVPNLGLNAGTEISFTSAKAEYVLYENYFDTADDIKSNEFTVYNSGGTALESGYSVSSSNWAEGGYLNISGGTHQLTILNTGISNVANDAMLVFEARIKHSAGSEAGQSSLTTVDYNSYPVFAVGSTMKAYGARIFSTGGGLGFLNMSGGTATTTIADYPIKRGVFYTYKITWDKANGNVKYSISNDEDETLKETEWQKFNNTTIAPNYIMLNSSRYFMASAVDYVRVYDETKLPHATVAETDLSSLKDGSTLTINFEQRIAESDLSKITVTGGAEIEKALSDDGKTVTLTFSNVENLKSYTLTVEDIGMNLGFTKTLKGADYDYMLYRNEFASADDVNNIYFTNGDSSDAGTALTASAWNSEGYFEAQAAGGSSIFLKNLDFANKVSDNSVVTWEAKVRYTETGKGGVTTDGGLTGGTQPLFGVGSDAKATGNLRIYGYNGKFAWATDSGVYPKDDTYAKVADYDLKSGEWYTFTIKYDTKAKKAQFSVCNAQNQSYTTDWESGNVIPGYSSVMLSGYAYFWKTAVDYFHIYDETLIPVPTVSGADLMNLKSGDKLTINFPFAVTSEELAGKVKIGENVQSLTLSEDGKTAEFTLSDIALRTKYTLTIEAVGKNPAVTEQLRGGEERKYYYRAEFDGNDDTSKLYTTLNGTGFSLANTSKIQNGVLTTDGMQYSQYAVVLGKDFVPAGRGLDDFACENIDVSDKKNVVYEMKIKLTGDTSSGVFQNKLLAIGSGVGSNKVQLDYTSGGLRYRANSDSADTDTYFQGMYGDYKMESQKWYTIKVTMNFVSQTYVASVADDDGDVATSGTLKFLYNSQSLWTNIGGFRLPALEKNDTYTHYEVDYIYLYDADDGKTEVTYKNGTVDIPLEGNVFVTGSETFSFEALSEVTNPQITAKTADGQNLNVLANAEGKKVSFTITDSIPADTKVIVTIAKETLGSESDQTVSFRTKWDENAEFVTPDMFKNKDTLDVVFFGGSITDQAGWRKTVTDGLKEMFSGKTVNCYNESWGGTGSSTGWNRLDMNVKPHNPDVVFVEYAVNDSYATGAAKWMESIIRSMNSWDKKPVIILVYTTVVDFNQNDFSVSEHTRVAEAYGVPYISVKDYVMSKYNEDSSFATDWNNKVYLTDGTHTKVDSDGFRLYGDYVNALLKHHSDHYFKLPKANSEVTKVVADSKDEAMEYTAGEVLDGTSKTFTFSGDELMLLFNYGAEMGSYTLVVDETTKEFEKSTHMTGSGVSRMFVSYSGFGDGEHTATITANALTVDDATYTKVNLMGYFQLPKAKAVFTKPEISMDGSTVKATFNYTTEVATDVTLILAAYKADGTLANIQFAPITLSAGTTSSSTTMPDSSDYVSFKAFVWDGLGSMQAKCVNGEYDKVTASAE